MTEIISYSEKIIERLEDEGKVDFLNKTEDLNAIFEMNNEMQIVRREYQIKDKNSQISAANVILTA